MRSQFIDRGTEVVGVIQSLKFKERIGWDWWRTAESLKVSVLWVGDEEGSWYHSCVNEAVELLSKYGVKRLVGHSMGGYGALLFGRLLGVRSYVFSPQTTLESELDRRWEDKWSEIRKSTPHPEYLTLRGWFDAEIYYCRDEELDRFHAERISGDLKPRGCKSHDGAFDGINWGQIFSW